MQFIDENVSAKLSVFMLLFMFLLFSCVVVHVLFHRLLSIRSDIVIKMMRSQSTSVSGLNEDLTAISVPGVSIIN